MTETTELDGVNKWSEEDLGNLKKWLSAMLNLSEVTVTFLKKDGSERVMKCTTNADIVPKATITEGDEPKKERKKNDDVKSVYDVESQAWKSFRWDSIKRIEFSL